jgi:hypothetical protein
MDRKLRLCNISVDGEPPRNEDDVNDILTGGLGWSIGLVRAATTDERATLTVGPSQGVDTPLAWWMVELPAILEQCIAEAEANDAHYWAAIWRQTLGTVWINVEVATTW